MGLCDVSFYLGDILRPRLTHTLNSLAQRGASPEHAWAAGATQASGGQEKAICRAAMRLCFFACMKSENQKSDFFL